MKRPTVQSWADAVLSALPVLMMGALAAWSFWLVRTTPGTSAPGSTRRVTQQPDLRVGVFLAETYDAQGQLKVRVRGQKAQHLALDDSMVVQQAQLWSLRAEPGRRRETTAQGEQLWVNGQQTRFRLSGRAQVEQLDPSPETARLRISSESLTWDEDLQQVSANQLVVIEQGKRQIHGDQLHYDRAKGEFSLRGNVRWVDSATPM